MGYVLFFPGLMTGPTFDFAEYKRWVTLTMFDVKVSDSSTGVTKRRRKIPRSGIPATLKLAEGTFWLIAYTVFSMLYTVEFSLSDEFLKYSFIRRSKVGPLNRQLILDYGICSLSDSPHD